MAHNKTPIGVPSRIFNAQKHPNCHSQQAPPTQTLGLQKVFFLTGYRKPPFSKTYCLIKKHKKKTPKTYLRYKDLQNPFKHTFGQKNIYPHLRFDAIALKSNSFQWFYLIRHHQKDFFDLGHQLGDPNRLLGPQKFVKKNDWPTWGNFWVLTKHWKTYG